MGRSKGLRKDRMYITTSEWNNHFGGKKKMKLKKDPLSLCNFFVVDYLYNHLKSPYVREKVMFMMKK